MLISTICTQFICQWVLLGTFVMEMGLKHLLIGQILSISQNELRSALDYYKCYYYNDILSTVLTTEFCGQFLHVIFKCHF